MKRSFLAIVIAVILSIPLSNGLYAQIPDNQQELMKQFVGKWRAEIGKDTVLFVDCKPFYSGFEFYLKTETPKKVIDEQKALFGYDKKIDKFIEFNLFSGSPNGSILIAWFTAPNRGEEVLIDDITQLGSILSVDIITNLNNARVKWIADFKSSTLMVWTQIIDKKERTVITFHKEK